MCTCSRFAMRLSSTRSTGAGRRRGASARWPATGPRPIRRLARCFTFNLRQECAGPREAGDDDFRRGRQADPAVRRAEGRGFTTRRVESARGGAGGRWKGRRGAARQEGQEGREGLEGRQGEAEDAGVHRRGRWWRLGAIERSSANRLATTSPRSVNRQTFLVVPLER